MKIIKRIKEWGKGGTPPTGDPRGGLDGGPNVGRDPLVYQGSPNQGRLLQGRYTQELENIKHNIVDLSGYYDKNMLELNKLIQEIRNKEVTTRGIQIKLNKLFDNFKECNVIIKKIYSIMEKNNE